MERETLSNVAQISQDTGRRISCSRLWFCRRRNTGGRKTPKASMEAGGGLNCWACLRFILPKDPVAQWEHCGQTLNPPATSFVLEGLPSRSVLLAVDMDASVNGYWQRGEMVTGLLLHLRHTRAGTAALQGGSKWVYSWLRLACPSKLAHFIQTACSLWSVKETMRITWDARLRTCFHEIFWFEANDKYFD